MIKHRRRVVIALVALFAFALCAAPHPRADIRILAQRPDDIAPQRVHAIVNIGLASVSVLVTWSKRLGY